MKSLRLLPLLLLLTLTVGCAGFNKGCAQFNAGSFGSDWIVVQYAADGRPFHCWKLRGASVEGSTGGNVDWQETGANAHLVHLTGWENRVQVVNGDFEGAAKLVGVDANQCGSGVYPKPAQ